MDIVNGLLEILCRAVSEEPSFYFIYPLLSKLPDLKFGRVTHWIGVNRYHLFGHSDSFQPVQDIGFRFADTVTGNCITIQHGGFRLQLPYGLDGTRETAAAMRTERDNSFTAEVVFIEERVEWHRHIVPPVGESNEDYIVVIEILDVCSQLRTGIVVYLDLCRIDQCLMRAGIGVYGLYLEKVAAR